jgi:AraC-like DNA-binding protein
VSTPLDYLRQLLCKRLLILEARQQRFVAGWHEAQSWVNSSRLIFVLDGEVRYTVEDQSVDLNAGSGILVPVNANRSWVVPVEQHCDLAWFRYSCPEGDEPQLSQALINPDAQFFLGKQTVDLLIKLSEDPNAADHLIAEAEAKAALARFITNAKPLGSRKDSSDRHSRGDVEVNRAVLFLNKRYAQTDALQQMAEHSKLSTAHLRKIFKAQMGCSPQEYLIRRRMQVARYELYHSYRQIKEIAAEVGYADPLYFSRAYSAFWGHPPGRDQHRRWSDE